MNLGCTQVCLWMRRGWSRVQHVHRKSLNCLPLSSRKGYDWTHSVWTTAGSVEIREAGRGRQSIPHHQLMPIPTQILPILIMLRFTSKQLQFRFGLMFSPVFHVKHTWPVVGVDQSNSPWPLNPTRDRAFLLSPFSSATSACTVSRPEICT